MITAHDVERATIAAWPAGETEARDGWFLLASSGVTGRVNAVWPLDWRGADIDAAITQAEHWYAARGLPPRFKLTDAAFSPADLPERLTQRGYAPGYATLVMLRELEGNFEGGDAELSPEMTSLFDQVLGDSTPNLDDLEERRAIARRAPKLTAFAIRKSGNHAAAVGMSALAGDLAGIFLMRTAPAARRRGHARGVLRALLNWAHAASARAAFLQVEADNGGAVGLYESEGFVTLTRYQFWKRAA